jgi:hypothetical protein
MGAFMSWFLCGWGNQNENALPANREGVLKERQPYQSLESGSIGERANGRMADSVEKVGSSRPLHTDR